ncbi:MAG: hypothetical protein JNK02_14830 [Planctomycetes bacterium]|nr:hypothetical protein [Planctomycetota bacterium]
MEPDPAASPARCVGRRRALVAAALLVLVAATAWFRAHAAFSDPQFDRRNPDGLLKSDPALLQALTARIVAAGGSIPEDFAADRTLEHPDVIDVAARFPLGHLVLVAQAHRLLGGGEALHVTAVRAAALSMALALAGVFLLARELAGSSRLALLAALLAAATPAFHRTIGFGFVDEDWFWPLFALHVGLSARAARLRSPGAVLAAALSAAAALATWHAAGFFLALEALVLLGVLAWTGRSPLAVRGGFLAPLALLVAALAVPFLREAGAWSSIPVAAAVGLWLATCARTPRGARALGLGAAGAIAAAGALAGEGAYGHVFALLLAKLEHLGLRPRDGSALDAEVRILWQGPFATPSLGHAAVVLSLSGALGTLAAGRALLAARERAPSVASAAAALCLLSLFAAWLAERALVLPALLAPPLSAWAASRLRAGPALLAGAALAQIALCATWSAGYRNPWYHAPLVRQAEIRWMVETVARVVPRGEPVAADFMTSAAILAKSGNPIVFSPKWEAREPRRRAAELLEVFHHRSPEEFRRLLVERYRVRWLVVDRFTLQYLARWSAGLPPGSFEPLPGTAAAALLAQDDAALRSIQGYELVARSPDSIRHPDGTPSDFHRIFRLAE